jgi:hypothetical protein
MKIAVSLPMPETVRNDNGELVSLVPIASKPDHAWYSGCNISENHAEFQEGRVRQLPQKGLGLTRVQVCNAQCGLPPALLFARAGGGQGSKAAKQQRC